MRAKKKVEAALKGLENAVIQGELFISLLRTSIVNVSALSDEESALLHNDDSIQGLLSRAEAIHEELSK